MWEYWEYTHSKGQYFEMQLVTGGLSHDVHCGQNNTFEKKLKKYSYK